MRLQLGVLGSDPIQVSEVEQIRIVDDANHKCAFCSFTSVPSSGGSATVQEQMGYMRVHTEPNGLHFCVCPFCYHTLNMELLPKPKLIYFPWLSQEKLNYLIQFIATVLRLNNVALHQKQANQIFLRLTSFAVHLRNCDTLLVEDPRRLTELLMWFKKEETQEYETRGRYLKHIRLIPASAPKFTGFEDALDYWGENKWYSDHMEERWLHIYEEFIAKKYREAGQ